MSRRKLALGVEELIDLGVVYAGTPFRWSPRLGLVLYRLARESEEPFVEPGRFGFES